MPAQLGKVAGTEHREPVPAAPHVRRLARELGVDIHEVKGSGPGGRISEDDVKAYAKSLLRRSAAAAVPLLAPDTSPQPHLARFREMGKNRTRFDARSAPQDGRASFGSVEHDSARHAAGQADITELEQLRARFAPKAEEAGGKMTVTAIALKVCAVGFESFSAIQCQHRHWEGRNRLQAVHQYWRRGGHGSRTAGSRDSRRG